MKVKNKKKLNCKAIGLLMSVILFIGLCASANAATTPLIYAYVKATKRLIAFRADSPTVLRSNVVISGLNAGENIGGIDFRPSTGQLYATGVTVSGNSTLIRLMTINPWTGVATQVGNQPQYITTGTRFGFDFSPAADVVREIDELADNYRFNSTTGVISSIDTNLAYIAGDPHAGVVPNIPNIAYKNSFAGSPSTELYGIEFGFDTLVRIGGVNANPSPNTGQVTTIGSLGIVTDTSEGGFDIYGTSNIAYAGLRVSDLSKLYRINLTTGAATLIGNIGNGDIIDGLAIAPTNNPFDFDGDLKTDLSIFRPAPGEWWYSRSIDNTSRTFQFGTSSDKLVPADYTGDGKTDVAIWRPSNGNWFILRGQDSTFYAFPFGANGDVPVPGDYDGDGRDDAAVFRPSTQTWYLNKSKDGVSILTFGIAGDKPVTADYDGDGLTDIAIFRPNGSSGGAEWWVRRSSTAQTFALQFGTSTDKPFQADYTGDGKADVAFFRPSNGNWFVLRSEDFSFYSFPLGASGDIAVPADYDGDGKTDAAVFRPSTSTWYANRTSGGTLIQGFGIAGDTPLPSVYLP
ncbi:hypothetical protein BH10ACI1_BH10ACI1_16540 [soil metagenome]